MNKCHFDSINKKRMTIILFNEESKCMEIRETEEDDEKRNKLIEWDLTGIQLEHHIMRCLITNKNNYLVLYQWKGRPVYFVEWIKTSDQMKLTDKIEMDDDGGIDDVKCLPNSNDLILIVSTGSLYYIHFDSNSNKLNKIKSKEYETGRLYIRLENEYLFVFGEGLGYMEMYKIEDLKRDKQLNNPTIIRIDKRIKELCLSIESKYLIIGTEEKELIVYKMNNLNDKPFASIQLNEPIWEIISSEQYISIDCGDSDNSRLLSFKINELK